MSFSSDASSFTTVTIQRDETLTSVYLNRTLRLDIVLPPDYENSKATYPVLYLNDGQDLERLRLKSILDSLYQQGDIRPFILVAIHCGDRIQEYGTAARADYMGRGAKAGDYDQFVVKELLPHIQHHYRASREASQAAFAGFSLGGLSAFDLVWNHPELFSKAGAFSGSFWWRSKPFDQSYSDSDRIMQALIREGKHKPGLKFWLQTGTLDETDDRDNDGVIDSIDDTLDLIAELERKRYRWGKDIAYVEVEGGHHDQETWSAIMPQFLTWAFGK
ncbi:alpha/beta hydrolase [Tellurirhabdus bombi]|uniref:alpha/beta hydrolase n=1 Tax=Tellurirhabdus bombi TaxID=2907205 RepID=UPI001EEBBE9E|nr:alpha/beta hydrolase-fold protein [Tellurirhabdus bombi]